MSIKSFLIICIIFSTYDSTSARGVRSAQELTRCIKIAEPLIHDPDFVFPLTVGEINNVCTKWEHFVICVKGYTATFLSLSQQRDFDNIIQPSMKSIHQLCSQETQYQQAYLHYAPCMKTISIEERYCGTHYKFLARLAESTADTGPAICCGYNKFRSCVLKEAKKECDRNKNGVTIPGGGDSTLFVSSMLNRALGFLLQMCKPDQSDSKDCLASLTGGRESKLNTIDNNVDSVNNGANFDGRDNNVNIAGFTGSVPTIGANDNTDNYNYNPRYPSDWSPSYPSSGATTSSPDRLPSQVTVYQSFPRNRNNFTWTTQDRSSFYPSPKPTYGDFLANEIRQPERFRGPNSVGAFAPSLTLMLISLLLNSAIVSTSQKTRL